MDRSGIPALNSSSVFLWPDIAEDAETGVGRFVLVLFPAALTVIFVERQLAAGLLPALLPEDAGILIEAADMPSLAFVGEHGLQNEVQLFPVFGGIHGDQQFDPAVEVARHQVGAADVILGRTVAGEEVDPGMFQKAVDDADDPDIGRGFRVQCTGCESADAADDQVDPDILFRGQMTS